MSKFPELNYDKAKATYQTLHLFTQIVGKIKLKKLPWINHSWHVTLLITPYGFTTGDMPDKEHHFQIDFDFCEHKLKIKTELGNKKEFELEGLSVADFYKKIMKCLDTLGIEVHINKTPNEIADAIPFDEDDAHHIYKPKHVKALHKAMLLTQGVFNKFRSEFRGKCSPVHLFWGALDVAVTRFSGRKAPKHPGGVPNLPNNVAQEAYSHEVSSCGFWGGNEMLPFAAYYSYAYPAPEGFDNATVKPSQAYYEKNLGEFILPYDAVRNANNPEQTLLEFLHSTYNAAADLGNWDRQSLEGNEFVKVG